MTMKFEKGSRAEIRRKLVRGSVAAPLLMTLRPSVAAAASANCWTNAPTTTNALGLADNPDELYRVQLQIYSVVVNSSSNGQKGTWQCYQKNGQYFTRSQQTSGPPNNARQQRAGLIRSHPRSQQTSGPPNNALLPAHTLISSYDSVAPIEGEFDYALAYVDSSGNVINSYPDAQASDTKPLMTSCWTSITTA